MKIMNIPFTQASTAAVFAAAAVGMLACAYSLGAASVSKLETGGSAQCNLYDEKYCSDWSSEGQLYSWCCTPYSSTCGDVTVTEGVATATCN
jgi:hypothetical protein